MDNQGRIFCAGRLSAIRDLHSEFVELFKESGVTVRDRTTKRTDAQYLIKLDIDKISKKITISATLLGSGFSTPEFYKVHAANETTAIKVALVTIITNQAVIILPIT